MLRPPKSGTIDDFHFDFNNVHETPFTIFSFLHVNEPSSRFPKIEKLFLCGEPLLNNNGLGVPTSKDEELAQYNIVSNEQEHNDRSTQKLIAQ